MDIDTCHVPKYAIYSYLKILEGKYKILSWWLTLLRDFKCFEKLWNIETSVPESSYTKTKKVREIKAERIKKTTGCSKDHAKHF